MRAERDHGAEAPPAALGHRHGAHGRHARAQLPLEAGCDRDAAEQRVLRVEAGQDRLVDGVASVREALERGCRSGAVALVAAVELRHGTLVDGRVEVELALEHELAARGHLERHVRAGRQRDRLSEQGAGDAQLVLAAGEVEAGGDQQRRMVAHRDGDRQPPALLARGPRGDREVMVWGDADEGA